MTAHTILRKHTEDIIYRFTTLEKLNKCNFLFLGRRKRTHSRCNHCSTKLAVTLVHLQWHCLPLCMPKPLLSWLHIHKTWFDFVALIAVRQINLQSGCQFIYDLLERLPAPLRCCVRLFVCLTTAHGFCPFPPQHFSATSVSNEPPITECQFSYRLSTKTRCLSQLITVFVSFPPHNIF